MPVSHRSARSEKDVKTYMGAGNQLLQILSYVKPYLLSLKDYALLNFTAVVVWGIGGMLQMEK